MGKTSLSRHRKTKETDVEIDLDLGRPDEVTLNTGLPFFDHLLHAAAFHGGFSLHVAATGDIDVDPHHLVEDVGIVIGELLSELIEGGSFARYGHAVVPMDDSLSTVTIDAGGRPFLVLQADFPQARSGDFDMALIREFFTALAHRGKITLHARCNYGLNSHHMAESLFKALGIAIKAAFSSTNRAIPSTKGKL